MGKKQIWGAVVLAALLAVLAGRSVDAGAATVPFCSSLGDANPGPASLRLYMPATIARGTVPATVWALWSSDGTDGGAVPGTVTVSVTDRSTGQVLASLYPSVLPTASDQNDPTSMGSFPVDQPLGTVDQISLTYDASSQAGPCEQSSTVAVTISTGAPPVIRTVDVGPIGPNRVHRPGLLLSPPSYSCDAEIDGTTQQSPVPLTETWETGKRTVTWHLTPCYTAVPTLPPAGVPRQLLPGLAVSDYTAEGGTNLTPTSVRDPWAYEILFTSLLRCRAAGTSPCIRQATYRLTIQLGSRILLTEHLISSYVHQNAYRVWQGTDAFVNYCIDQHQQKFSSHRGRYCEHAALTYSEVQTY